MTNKNVKKVMIASCIFSSDIEVTILIGFRHEKNRQGMESHLQKTHRKKILFFFLIFMINFGDILTVTIRKITL